MNRRTVLMIEVDADTDVEALIPDARVWGEVDPCDAALLVIDVALASAA